jgi:hypothetical protein
MSPGSRLLEFEREFEQRTLVPHARRELAADRESVG